MSMEPLKRAVGSLLSAMGDGEEFMKLSLTKGGIRRSRFDLSFGHLNFDMVSDFDIRIFAPY